MDSGLLSEMLGEILEKNFEIDSVTIVRNGYMVVDARIHPFSPISKHNIYESPGKKTPLLAVGMNCHLC